MVLRVFRRIVCVACASGGVTGALSISVQNAISQVRLYEKLKCGFEAETLAYSGPPVGYQSVLGEFRNTEKKVHAFLEGEVAHRFDTARLEVVTSPMQFSGFDRDLANEMFRFLFSVDTALGSLSKQNFKASKITEHTFLNAFDKLINDDLVKTGSGYTFRANAFIIDSTFEKPSDYPNQKLHEYTNKTEKSSAWDLNPGRSYTLEVSNPEHKSKMDNPDYDVVTGLVKGRLNMIEAWRNNNFNFFKNMVYYTEGTEKKKKEPTARFAIQFTRGMSPYLLEFAWVLDCLDYYHPQGIIGAMEPVIWAGDYPGLTDAQKRQYITELLKRYDYNKNAKLLEHPFYNSMILLYPFREKIREVWSKPYTTDQTTYKDYRDRYVKFSLEDRVAVAIFVDRAAVEIIKDSLPIWSQSKEIEALKKTGKKLVPMLFKSERPTYSTEVVRFIQSFFAELHDSLDLDTKKKTQYIYHQILAARGVTHCEHKYKLQTTDGNSKIFPFEDIFTKKEINILNENQMLLTQMSQQQFNPNSVCQPFSEFLPSVMVFRSKEHNNFVVREMLHTIFDRVDPEVPEAGQQYQTVAAGSAVKAIKQQVTSAAGNPLRAIQQQKQKLLQSETTQDKSVKMKLLVAKEPTPYNKIKIVAPYKTFDSHKQDDGTYTIVTTEDHQQKRASIPLRIAKKFAALLHNNFDWKTATSMTHIANNPISVKFADGPIFESRAAYSLTFLEKVTQPFSDSPLTRLKFELEVAKKPIGIGLNGEVVDLPVEQEDIGIEQEKKIEQEETEESKQDYTRRGTIQRDITGRHVKISEIDPQPCQTRKTKTEIS